jgi:hypothetical protein
MKAFPSLLLGLCGLLAQPAAAELAPPTGVQVGLAAPGGFSAPPKSLEVQAVDTQQYLRNLVQTKLVNQVAELQQAAKARLEAIRRQYPNLSPDEIDIRIDIGGAEVGFDPLETEKLPIKEITLKHPSGMEMSFGLKGTWEKPEWDGKVKYGFAYDKAAEVKYGIDIDTNKDTNDYYDGEWQKASEWRVIRLVEDTVAKVDFYVGGAAGIEQPVNIGVGDKVNIGVEVSWNLRERYTNWLFKDMYDSLDQLLEQQQSQEGWRRGKIEQEARRLGIDPTGKNTRQLMNAIHEVWRQHPEQQRPIFRPPGGYLAAHHQQRDWYCTNRPQISAPVALPSIVTRR